MKVYVVLLNGEPVAVDNHKESAHHKASLIYRHGNDTLEVVAYEPVVNVQKEHGKRVEERQRVNGT